MPIAATFAEQKFYLLSDSRRTLLALWALPLSLMLALIVGPILRDGMFIDGLAYTNIAKNLYQGHGSLWAPVVDVGGPVFYSHPVLLPYVESFFFHLLGNHTYTEDVYNFTVLALTVWLMYLIWKRVAGRRYRAYFFFPLLLFALSQEVQLRYPNTMLECGMTLILLTFTYLYLRLRERLPWLAVGLTGVGAFSAFLAKGPVGLFILGLPFLYAVVVERRFRLSAALLPLGVAIGCFGILFLLQPAAYDFVVSYLDRQVLASVQGRNVENMASSRFAFMRSLVLLNVPALLLCGALWWIGSTPPPDRRRNAVFFLLVGASAIFPLVLSPKQASYYQIPSLPYFFTGLGLLLLPRLVGIVDYFVRYRVPRRILQTIGAVGVVATAVLALSMLGTTDRRDIVPLAQANRIATVMDSLDYGRYRFVVLGERRRFESAMSYTVTGFLNRWHDIYREYDASAELPTLYLLTEGGVFPTDSGGRVLYVDEQLLLVEE